MAYIVLCNDVETAMQLAQKLAAAVLFPVLIAAIERAQAYVYNLPT